MLEIFWSIFTLILRFLVDANISYHIKNEIIKLSNLADFNIRRRNLCQTWVINLTYLFWNVLNLGFRRLGRLTDSSSSFVWVLVPNLAHVCGCASYRMRGLMRMSSCTQELINFLNPIQLVRLVNSGFVNNYCFVATQF